MAHDARQCSLYVPAWQAKIETPNQGTRRDRGRRTLPADGDERMKFATLIGVLAAAFAVILMLAVAPA
ncbi:hypothetical protein [Phenylobacterium sp.]|uniref:hypothetical protein n=1 Tax=Phenylobacterium sp. TaxID=1871053 RepID=UPI0025D8615B|nr:hypothetical protein [Phenylobacterium sp.]